MKSAILQKTGKKLFAAHLEQYAPADPLYEEYVDNKGRKKRRRVGPTPPQTCGPYHSTHTHLAIEARDSPRALGPRCQDPQISQTSRVPSRQGFQCLRDAVWMGLHNRWVGLSPVFCVPCIRRCASPTE